MTLYTEGRRAATIQNGGPQVRRRAAPNGEEFLRTGIHLLVQGNHVSYVAEGHTNDGQITSLFHRFFQHCNRPVSDTQFALQPRADRAQIEALLAAGVKSIDLGMSAFETTVNDLNDAAPVGGIANRFRALIDAIQSIGGPDRSPEQIEAASEIQARVHLGYDGRTSNHLLPSLLATIASDVAESAGEFKILTNDDVLITHDKLVIKREVDVEGDDVAIESASAFAVLRDTMHGWRQAGIFDQ
ncbi:MAG: hypothetical protein EOQ39_03655 [Mesorhizobium sp.]|uniref:hypothetical protein n=1 Tax=Mesorhizobium sp. TaxID=1871066 RepID=UPI000FE84164|nr:hypothetical protein [Mesorhizobium sp.]RWB09006.1 MAG: hypothetical protein EOQ37_05810 [Mesorhizobium sp.]RWB17427.1 MAG: hypothetical protein EOQ39_03655 [Mesorhizobium sp.]